MIITSNLVFSEWDRIFKDPMTTAAAIDRLVHHSVIVEMTDKCIRIEDAQADQTLQGGASPTATRWVNVIDVRHLPRGRLICSSYQRCAACCMNAAMKKLGCVFLCVACLATVGCKKKDNAAAGGSGSAAAPAGSAAGSATAAAPSGNKADCAPGAYIDPKGAFCVTIPEGYKNDDGGKTDASDGEYLIVFNNEGGYTYSIKVVPKESFDNYKGAMVTKPDNKDGIKVEVDEKIGTDGVYQRKKNDKSIYQWATVKRGEGYVVCEAAPGETPTKPEDACKTLRAL